MRGGDKKNMTIRGIFDDLKMILRMYMIHKQILIIFLQHLLTFFLAYNLLLPYSNQMFGSVSKLGYNLLTAKRLVALLERY